MFDKIKKTGKNTAIYGIGNLLNKSSGLILIPFIQKYVPIGDYGWLTVLELIILSLSSTIILGITQGHERFFYKEKESGTYGIFLFSSSTSLILLSFGILSLFAIFSQPLSIAIFKTQDYQFAILLVLLITFLEVNNVLPFQILQYEEKAMQYIIANSSRFLISLLLSVFFVAQLKLGIIGVLYGRLLGSGLFAIFQYITVIIPRIVIKFSFEKVKTSVQYGLPMVLSGLGYIIFSMSDRFMLSQLSTSEQTGKYGFGYKIASIVMLIVQSIGVGYLPSFYQQEKKENNERYYRKMLTYYTFSMSYLVLAFLFFYKLILRPFISNGDYWNGLHVVPLLSFGFLIMGMNYFVNLGIILKNKTKYFLIPTFISAIINIILICIFIPWLGFFGPALSTLISQIIYTCLITFISQRLKNVKFEWGKVFLSLFIAIIFFVLGGAISFDSKLITALVRLVFLAAYPFILYKLKFFELIEIERILGTSFKIYIRGKKLFKK